MTKKKEQINCKHTWRENALDNRFEKQDCCGKYICKMCGQDSNGCYSNHDFIVALKIVFGLIIPATLIISGIILLVQYLL